MPDFAAYLYQHSDYAGPEGFVSVSAEDEVAAFRAVVTMADRHDTAGSSRTTVQFVLPLQAALQARDHDGTAVEIRPAAELLYEPAPVPSPR